ncbi:MAG TPA: DUF167 domain-containing protein [Allosphingosinicella sp.]
MAKPRPKLPPREAILALADDQGRLAVRASPNAATDAIFLPEEGGALRVRVTAPPEDGRANAAILALLAKALGQPPSSLTLLRGASARDKLIEIG